MIGWSSARRGALAGVTVATLLATMALGACGASPQSQAKQGATSPTATTGGVIPGGGGGMAVRPCPGAVSDATQAGSIALILTPGKTSGSLHVGELAQVRLPTSDHWTLLSQPTLMASVATAGGQDNALNACFWTFRAQSAGSETLKFSGMAPCEQPGACSTAVSEQDFTITIS
ncbi:MAG TPA: hypothetical protein VFN78_03245 [Ktedonobacterales bacterium]|nr:hypothetical protein [Ktedonobacterales bacterium]